MPWDSPLTVIHPHMSDFTVQARCGLTLILPPSTLTAVRRCSLRRGYGVIRATTAATVPQGEAFRTVCLPHNQPFPSTTDTFTTKLPYVSLLGRAERPHTTSRCLRPFIERVNVQPSPPGLAD